MVIDDAYNGNRRCLNYYLTFIFLKLFYIYLTFPKIPSIIPYNTISVSNIPNHAKPLYILLKSPSNTKDTIYRTSLIVIEVSNYYS